MYKFTLCVMILVLSITIPANAGSVGGPKHARSVIYYGQINMYKFNFEANKVAIINVIGDGSSNLDCQLANSKGTEVDRDNNLTDTCYLKVFPNKTDVYRVYVRNYGKVNEYRLDTN